MPADNRLSGTSLGHRGQLGQEVVYNAALSRETLRGLRACVTPGESGEQSVLGGCSLTWAGGEQRSPRLPTLCLGLAPLPRHRPAPNPIISFRGERGRTDFLRRP